MDGSRNEAVRTSAPFGAAGAAIGSLPRKTLLLYALPSLPYSVAYMPVVNFIPGYYSNDLGVPLAIVGFALFATRMFDIPHRPCQV